MNLKQKLAAAEQTIKRLRASAKRWKDKYYRAEADKIDYLRQIDRLETDKG